MEGNAVRDEMDQDSETLLPIHEDYRIRAFLREQLQRIENFISGFTSREQMVARLQRILLRPHTGVPFPSYTNFDEDIDIFTSQLYGLFRIDWSRYTRETIEEVAIDLGYVNIILHRTGPGLRHERFPTTQDRFLFREYLLRRRESKNRIAPTHENVDCLRRFAATSLEEGETCTICLENFALQDDLVQLPCCHSFHYECAKSWLRRKPNCPVDRSDISMKYSN